MQIINLPLNQIIPYDKNPRHNEQAIEAVAKSLAEFGWQQPIVVDKDHIIIVGHTRLAAAKRLGYKEAPCVVADNLTEGQVTAYRLADNKTGELATWDTTLLEQEIEKLTDTFQMDMAMFGFDMSEFMAEPTKSADKDGAQEYELEDFADEKFKCECPKCGFKFNP